MGILSMGISGEKKIYKTGFKRECLYFILIIFPQNFGIFFALESAAMGHPRKGVNQSQFGESIKPLQITQAEDPAQSPELL